jgi:predicted TIM-barrel fold metal-dependent hydrolase
MKDHVTALLLLCLLQAASAANAQDKVFDVHVHLWDGEKSVQGYLSQLGETNQQVTRFGGIWMARLGELAETRQKNDELIALAVKHPRMMPIASVHPYDGQAAFDELKRIVDRGVRVIKLHPHTQKFDVTDPRVAALCKRAGELGVVVLMDNANIIPGDSENLFNLAVATPKTRFVFTHMGALNFRFWNIVPLVRTAKDFWPDNLYFEISGIVVLAADSPIEQEFIWTIRNVGIDRVVIGSDYPQMSLAQAVDALERLDLNRSEKDKILYGNAQALFAPKTPD